MPTADASDVLISCFEPFFNRTTNSSQIVVDLLRTQVSAQFTQLPVTYGGAFSKLNSVMTQLQPKIVLALGQAEGRRRLSVERVALNWTDTHRADNEGSVLTDTPVQPGAPDICWAPFPAKNIVHRLTQENHPIEVSYSAGTFVCNHLAYQLYSELRRRKRPSLGVFIHIPLLSEQVEYPEDLPRLDPNQATDAMNKVVSYACEYLNHAADK